MGKPTYEMPAENSPRGNIYVIIGEVSKLLKDEGLESMVDEMTRRITSTGECKSYEHAKKIIGEYVNVI